MAKKFKIKNEDPSINFRLPQELKTRIIKEAAYSNKTVSNYLRDHFEEFLDGRLFEKEISYYQSHSYINTTEFIQLITWILSMKHQPPCKSSNEQLDEYIGTIKNMQSHFEKSLEMEFDKVLADLLRVRYETVTRRYFLFCGGPINAPTFDYSKLETFLLTLDHPKYHTSRKVK